MVTSRGSSEAEMPSGVDLACAFQVQFKNKVGKWVGSTVEGVASLMGLTLFLEYLCRWPVLGLKLDTPLYFYLTLFQNPSN